VPCAAVARLAEGQFLRATENWVKLITLRDGALRLILSMKEGQNIQCVHKVPSGF
jgi:hypothetical protein